MVDNFNPTNQFHPYQRTEAVPHAEAQPTGLSSILKKAGIDTSRLGGSTNMQQKVEQVRRYAQQHPGVVLGGLSALAIGLGMMRGRR